jgi:hypothetical protein
MAVPAALNRALRAAKSTCDKAPTKGDNASQRRIWRREIRLPEPINEYPYRARCLKNRLLVRCDFMGINRRVGTFGRLTRQRFTDSTQSGIALIP